MTPRNEINIPVLGTGIVNTLHGKYYTIHVFLCHLCVVHFLLL